MFSNCASALCLINFLEFEWSQFPLPFTCTTCLQFTPDHLCVTASTTTATTTSLHLNWSQATIISPNQPNHLSMCPILLIVNWWSLTWMALWYDSSNTRSQPWRLIYVCIHVGEPYQQWHVRAAISRSVPGLSLQVVWCHGVEFSTTALSSQHVSIIWITSASVYMGSTMFSAFWITIQWQVSNHQKPWSCVVGLWPREKIRGAQHYLDWRLIPQIDHAALQCYPYQHLSPSRQPTC